MRDDITYYYRRFSFNYRVASAVGEANESVKLMSFD